MPWKEGRASVSVGGVKRVVVSHEEAVFIDITDHSVSHLVQSPVECLALSVGHAAVFFACSTTSDTQRR